MEVKGHKITITTTATLVYYISEPDIHEAIGLALEAPYSEWEVSEFDMPADSNVIAVETRH
jgi:hypothetical protein